MLLIDHCQSDVFEYDSIFYQGMGANNNMNAALFEPLQYTAALLCFYRSREYRYGYRHVFQQIANALKVLLGQYLGRCHHATLVAIVRCDKHAQ
ncbi:hypothetical protein D3C87_2039820 [compost metagenome]